MPTAWSSMPIPWDMLPQTVTLTTNFGTQQSAGSFELTDPVAITVMGNLQPASSSDANIYRRETGTTLYTLFLAPTSTTGADVATNVSHITKVTIDSVDYFTDGEPLNLCSHGAVVQLNVYRRT
jgi:hypothetical protein